MYELWDVEGRNVLRFFTNATEALDVIGEAVRQKGPDILAPLALMRDDGSDEDAVVAEGQAILVAVKRLSAEEAVASPARRAV
jgi:hypothetical protein